MISGSDKFFVEKELSWLSFNERVLQEASDASVPVVERVRFLGIYSNNMDEFFRVRVAAVRRRLQLGSFTTTLEKDRHLLQKIQTKVLLLQEKFDAIYAELMRELVRCNIFLVNELQLTHSHSQWLKKHFRDNLKQHFAPLIINNQQNLPKLLRDDTTYLAVSLNSEHKRQYALIEVPTKNVPRFIALPPEQTKRKKYLILLDNVIRHCVHELFSPFFDYSNIEVYSMKITRDAEFDLNTELEHSQLEKISLALKQRLTAEPVRLVYDREMPEHMLTMLKDRLGISGTECLVPGGRYHSFKDFIGFPNPGRKHLEHPKLKALKNPFFYNSVNKFDALRRQDILLYYPYHRFSHLTELLRQAAYDPAVRFIKINVYRVAKHSQIMHSLMEAVKNGKKVTAVIELAARFDEQANIEWSRRLSEAGVRVHHGIPSLKIHAKMCLIGREEAEGMRLYAHIGTGNFNESTARIYTDFALFTAHPEIGAEVEQVFELIEHPYRRYHFNQLLVSPYNVRQKIDMLLDHEIAMAQAGQTAAVTLKVNNLVDMALIDRLYEASAAGVNIRLMVRGMCALIPGIKGISDNIRVYSVVDRFLEHARVMHFHHSGENKVFITSADWMTRNLDERIEVGTQILDEQLKQTILDILAIQFSDNTKNRIINQDQTNPYHPRGNKRKVRSQLAILDYLQNREKTLAAAIAPMDEDVESGYRRALEPVIAADGQGGMPINCQEKAS
ncbi:polyphosphate kinase 1 [Shewanella sp. GXUN23E]|uniref:polyphosphate kinase 1 n=1 Tax=Shewanella sp. GXUN23E TaxID=3422498 RepID=UPI003D7D52A6